MDGTLLGRDGSLFRDADGAFTMLAARALEACARAEVEVVPYSGRRRSTLLHDARLLGLRSYIFEAGGGAPPRGAGPCGGLVLGGEVRWVRRRRTTGRRTRCCSSATPAGWRCTTRGSWGASRRGCTSATASTPRRPTSCSRAPATGTSVWSTTAPCTASEATGARST